VVASALRVGVQLPEVEREIRWPEYARVARAAEEVGFDSIWIGDHYLYRGDGRPERGPWEAWALLAGLAAITERVSLGPLVASTAFANPAVLAKRAATVDEISGGRLVVGLGAGWNEAEFRAFGIPYDHRASRFEESFEIVRRLLNGERVTFRGRFHAVDDALLLPAPARSPRLMTGTEGDRLLRATLPHADAWNTWFDDIGNRPEGFAPRNEHITEIAEEVGRDPAEVERSVCVLVEVDPASTERPHNPAFPPIALDGLGPHLAALAEAGADEAILVLSPIDERSVRIAGEVVRGRPDPRPW
jgi:alkanesulfonate monooxygenase SsuD/methylene tetrahydromethanopterin reductase-like flavin-dependent oxidoreductase (luciferase family)